MFGLGTVINTGAVIAGSLVGMTLKRGSPKIAGRFLCMHAGLLRFLSERPAFCKNAGYHRKLPGNPGKPDADLFIGLRQPYRRIDKIEYRLECAGEYLKRKLHTEGDLHFVEGFVTSTLVICIGAMAIVGAIEDGLTGNYSTLTAKAILDFVIVMIFASTLGKGVAFSAIPLFLYQGAITCAAAVFGDFMSTGLIDHISYVGSALIFCVGVNIAFGKNSR